MVEQVHIGRPEALEAAVEPDVDPPDQVARVGVPLAVVVEHRLAEEEIVDEGRHDRAREQVRGEHREHDRHR